MYAIFVVWSSLCFKRQAMSHGKPLSTVSPIKLSVELGFQCEL